MVTEDKVAFFADPGCGKTLTTLVALEQLKGKTLIVAPIRVIQTVWRQEAVKWNIALSFSLLRGNDKQRLAALQQDANVYLINPELLPWLFARDKHIKWDNLVVDESSLFKNPSTVRFKTLKKQLSRFKKRFILTGTPCSNSLLDLWSQIGILDKGERLGTAFGRFKDTYFESDYMGFKWTIRKGCKEQIEKLISDITIRLDAKDYLSLPDMIEDDIVVELEKSEMRDYRHFAANMIMNLVGKELTALSAVSLHIKLSQLANGMVYGDDAEPQIFHKQKFKALEEIIDEINAPTIVVYKYIHEKNEILKMFPHAVIFNEGDSEQHVKDWNAGKIDMLLLHPASGGHGINLQDGGNHMVWFGPISSLEQYIQTTKRLHRSGQQKPVFVYRIIAKDTVDEDIARTLKVKDAGQSSFLDAMKAYLVNFTI